MEIVVSQVGYDLGKSKKAYVSGAPENATFCLTNGVTKQPELKDSLQFWGEKWGKNWYIADFSSLEKAGEYQLQICCGEDVTTADTVVHIGNGMLWHKTWHACSLGQLDVRASNCYPEGGWRDCGSELQEVSSHVIMLDALCDLWHDRRLPELERAHLRAHLLRGADYILCCQQPEGGFVHELHHNPSVSITNCANAAAVLARVAGLVSEKADIYREAAVKALEFVESYDFFSVHGENESLQTTHGAPAGMTQVPKQHRTRDLLSLLDAYLRLYKLGLEEMKEKAISLTERILARQIPESAAEHGLFGHFYTYEGYTFSEKANYHCGAWDLPYKNYNQGTHKPYWVMPLFEMLKLFPEEAQAESWRKALHDFAYGFFLPVCKDNPFGIIPAGVYEEGILYFSGWYHGHAKIYGYAAQLAMECYVNWDDPAFLEIATGNIQWIAGLNVGNISLIVDVGDRTVQDWNSLRGTIVNGFDASPQFRLQAVSKETDLPAYLDDEGGIHHCAGLLAGLCAIE